MKQKLRGLLAKTSSYLEITISAVVLLGIAIAGIDFVKDFVNMFWMAFVKEKSSVTLEDFLAQGLQLIIGVEFVKMIAKHTMGSTIEVLVYAIARKLVVSHDGALEVLLEVIAIAVLFSIKRYLRSSKETYNDPEELVRPEEINPIFSRKKPKIEE